MLSEKCFVVFYVFSFPVGVYVGTLNLIASIPDPSILTFWSGRKSEERREAGVGFAIKTELVGKLSGLPKGINDRLMTLRLPLSGNKHATIVSA